MYNETRPFFSIVIASFNSGSTIGTCLASILNQRFDNFEVLIQDGGSTDETIFIIKNVNDKRIKINIAPDNGIYDAMNKAIGRVLGSWIIFLGSDDSLFDENVLTRIYQAAISNRKSRFIYGDVFTSDKLVQQYKNYNFRRLIEVNICHQAIFYSRILFSTIQYDLKYEIFADWDFNLKVFRRSNFPLYIAIPISNYNLEGKSARWINLQEYLVYFSNKKNLALRYRGVLYFWGYCSLRIAQKIWRFIRQRK